MLLNVENNLRKEELRMMKKAMQCARYFRYMACYFAGYFCYVYYFRFRKENLIALPA